MASSSTSQSLVHSRESESRGSADPKSQPCLQQEVSRLYGSNIPVYSHGLVHNRHLKTVQIQSSLQRLVLQTPTAFLLHGRQSPISADPQLPGNGWRERGQYPTALCTAGTMLASLRHVSQPEARVESSRILATRLVSVMAGPSFMPRFFIRWSVVSRTRILPSTRCSRKICRQTESVFQV